MDEYTHISVLKVEAVAALQIKPAAWYIDATFGRGGHTSEILAAGGNVFALDCDEAAVRYAQVPFEAELQRKQLLIEQSNFDHLAAEWSKTEAAHSGQLVHGVLFDFGVSSPQLTDPERGFSFQHDGPLDMRMDHRLGVQAKDLLAVLPEKQLAELFWTYGGEEQSRKLAKVIVKARMKHPFTTTREFAEFIARHRPRTGHLHPATKVFQALRIAVNSELDSIETALPQALEVLQPAGRIITISFHEGEDRIAKHTFQRWEHEQKGRLLTKKAITPSETELTHNTRARSAKLRIFEKN